MNNKTNKCVSDFRHSANKRTEHFWLALKVRPDPHGMTFMFSVFKCDQAAGPCWVGSGGRVWFRLDFNALADLYCQLWFCHFCSLPPRQRQEHETVGSCLSESGTQRGSCHCIGMNNRTGDAKLLSHQRSRRSMCFIIGNRSGASDLLYCWWYYKCITSLEETHMHLLCSL